MAPGLPKLAHFSIHVGEILAVLPHAEGGVLGYCNAIFPS
jgi:hypothetical protein